jgi:hypothetical protein
MLMRTVRSILCTVAALCFSLRRRFHFSLRRRVPFLAAAPI